MGKIKVVSFDVEGTMITPDFSQAVWHEGIPTLYAERKLISFEKAKAMVEKEYQKVGDHRVKWYDIEYWFQHFQLGDYRRVLEGYRHKVAPYPEAVSALSSLGKKYPLIIISATPREFLEYMLAGVEGYFTNVFSSISDYGQLKNLSLYLTICHELNIFPNEMAHIGDSWEFDFLAAKEAGIKAFHLNREEKQRDGKSLRNLTDVEAKLLDE